MKKAKKILKKLWQDESGQGTTEYILLLVVVVAVAFLFKDQIKTALSDKLTELGGQISGFTGD